jgi:hypothetical protein
MVLVDFGRLLLIISVSAKKHAFWGFLFWVITCSVVEIGSLFKDYETHTVQAVDEQLEQIIAAVPLNYWLSKFVQKVANENGGRYTPRTLYQIVCDIKRYLEEQKR